MGEGFAVGLCAFRVGLQPPRISRLGHLARSEGERTQCRLRFRRMKLKTVPLKKARAEHEAGSFVPVEKRAALHDARPVGRRQLRHAGLAVGKKLPCLGQRGIQNEEELAKVLKIIGAFSMFIGFIFVFAAEEPTAGGVMILCGLACLESEE